jgi:hypothetical protein
MTLKNIAKDYVNDYIGHMKYATTFSSCEYVREKWNIREKVKGLYFLYKEGTKTLVYIGMTGRCLKSRWSRHKASIVNPKWDGERSGRAIHKKGLHCDAYDVYYIEMKDLKIKDPRDLKIAEDLFIKRLKPAVYG